MNHIQWIQQREDFNTKYHVIKWKTSHFHEPFSERMVGSAKLQYGAAPETAKQSQQPEGEGIGFAQTELSKSSGFGLGSGLEGYALKTMQEEMAQSAVRNSGNSSQTGRVVGAISASVQTAAAAQMQAAEHTVTPEHKREPLRSEQAKERNVQEATTVSAAGKGNIRNRLRENAARLQEFYRRQKEKAAKLTFWKSKPESEKKKVLKGTRMADREEILSMQAENHYLLDSYDQKGNYSILGK